MRTKSGLLFNRHLVIVLGEYRNNQDFRKFLLDEFRFDSNYTTLESHVQDEAIKIFEANNPLFNTRVIRANFCTEEWYRTKSRERESQPTSFITAKQLLQMARKEVKICSPSSGKVVRHLY
jgi:hypothetical protein